jgi:hypothetical protein
MITFLVLTYKRKKYLDECVYSYITQKNINNTEMLIINDDVDVNYRFNHPNIRIINHNKRFKSLGDKLKFGFDKSNNDLIYRLDDDDMLIPNAIDYLYLKLNKKIIEDYLIFRSREHYLFEDDIFSKIRSNLNSGNIYRKDLMKIIPSISHTEDVYMIQQANGKIYEFDKPTMIYRNNADTYSFHDIGRKYNNNGLEYVRSKYFDYKGIIELKPQFYNEYYSQLKK